MLSAWEGTQAVLSAPLSQSPAVQYRPGTWLKVWFICELTANLMLEGEHPRLEVLELKVNILL